MRNCYLMSLYDMILLTIWSETVTTQGIQVPNLLLLIASIASFQEATDYSFKKILPFISLELLIHSSLPALSENDRI